jgi:hypothetical protein
MLHACFYTNCFVFCLHFVAFYVFSRTNLLTRCHSASSCFLLFLYFRKGTQEIFSKLDETKSKVPIYLTRRRSPKERRTRTRRRPHHRVVWAPGPRSDIALSPINSLPLMKYFSMKHTASRRRCRPEIGRVQKLFPAPCRRGESSPEAFFITMPASGVMRE